MILWANADPRSSSGSSTQKTFCAMQGQEGGSIDVDDEFARQAMSNFGASSSAAICSVLCAARGRTSHGRGGGGQSAVPCGYLRSDALRTRADRDGGRDDFPLRYGRNPRSAAARPAGGGR